MRPRTPGLALALALASVAALMATSWDPGAQRASAADQIQTPFIGTQRPSPADPIPTPTPTPIIGTNSACEDFELDILSGFITDVLELGILDDLGIYDIDEEIFQADLPDEGWVWTNPVDKFKEVEGVVEGSHTATIDFPATHDSHDQNTVIHVDPEYLGLLSSVNGPNGEGTSAGELVAPDEIEMEWEVGTWPDETGRNELERYFPRWAWPAIGDRVWAEGHWTQDCGHATTIDGARRFRSEIHPARAIAAMRQQVHGLPGSGTTQVPVTATDLYIHGRSGFVTEILKHGQSILLDDVFDTDHDPNDHETTPIDANYEFEVCLPQQPSAGAVPSVSIEDGSGNNIDIAPTLTIEDAVGPCTAAGPKQLKVEVKLAGSGVAPTQVYARKIYVGWVEPAASLRHIIVTLNQMDLHTDKEVEGSLGGDCECTFFFVNLDKASDEWDRLADWWRETCNISVDVPGVGTVCVDHNTLGGYDSDELLGNGLLNFNGPTFDFLVANGQPFHIRSSGYDQDCVDDLFSLPLLNDHEWDAVKYSLCYYAVAITTFEKGRNDDFARLNACFVESDEALCDEESEVRYTNYGIGTADVTADHEFEMVFDISEEPVIEDPADLAAEKTCEHGGEVALIGQPFTCTITVTNAGPGLPRDVVVNEAITTVPAGVAYTMGTPTSTITYGGRSGAPQPCTVTPPGQISCAIGSVPVGGSASISVEITPSAAGTFNDVATVTSSTADPSSTNNTASASVRVFLPVTIDVRPGVDVNTVNLGANGVIDVAIVRTATFNSSLVDFRSVCFGDAGDPAQRDCSETHGKSHAVDVDKDKDLDMVLHYEVEHSGIDPGDTTACLIGSTTAGIGIYGCDTISTQ